MDSVSNVGVLDKAISLLHAIERIGPATIVEADVTYTRLDGSTVTVPVVTIYRSRGGRIDDYRVFIDLAPVFA